MVKKATTEEIEKPNKSCKRSISTPGAIISSKEKQEHLIWLEFQVKMQT